MIRRTMPTIWGRLGLTALLAMTSVVSSPLGSARAQLNDAGIDQVARATVMVVATVVEVTRGIPTREHQRVPLGSGILVSDDGLILTNSHVIDPTDLESAVEDQQNATGIDLDVAPGYLIYVIDSLDDDLDARYTAELVEDAPEFDLAVLRITGDEDRRPLRRQVGDDRMPIALALDDTVTLREPVIILGYPVFGQASFAEIGATPIDILDSRVRSLQRFSGLGTIQYIQFDAIVSKGSSGGAVVNEAGELIGVMAEARGGASGGSAAVAIPVDRARAVLVAAGWTDPEPPTGPTPEPGPSSIAEPTGVADAEVFQIGETVATTDVVNLRTQPTTASPAQTQLPAGTLLQIKGAFGAGSGPAWWQVVRFETDEEGWVRGDFLERSDAAPATVTPATQSLGTGRLAYAALIDGSWDIFVYHFAAGSSTQLTSDAGRDQTAPAWSHAGDRLAYVSGGPGAASQVWVMNGDGTDPYQVTSYVGSATIYYVEWAVGDEELIVTLAGGGEAWLMTAPAAGGELTPFVSPPASHPAVGPDGQMVYVTVGGPNLDLLLVDPAGNIINTVAGSADWEDMPSISRDGQRVAYQIGEKGARRIVTSSISGVALFMLPPIGSDDSNPVWSPDGEALALVATLQGRDTVWVVTRDGRDRRQLDLGDPESVWYLSWTA